MFGGQPTTVPRPCKEWLYDFHRVKSGPRLLVPEVRMREEPRMLVLTVPIFLILAPHYNTTIHKFNRIA